ncbi:hypothetical protein JTE90_026845 [Oedothorax gibbosus]|uniref:Pre-C2HC domain-containing protein n=1 Tax=Oedothorax gibbosus TaxID=931172 RepID=A0AAV6TZ09_9ARAC|nr:hypothetical protein JTE90_026845 [Oedothorax gibbosus]
MEINDDPDGNGRFITPIKKTPSIGNSTNYEASSASNASNNDPWKKMPNRLTAKRKHQSSTTPDFEHPNKYKISDENSENQNDIEIDDPFQTTTTGPTSRIPPFIITNPQFNWIEFRKKIKSSYPEEQFTGKANGENFKLQMKTPIGYRLICSMLKNDGIHFSTYGFKDQNPLKAVIRNIPADIPTDDILAELKEQNIPVQRVHQLKKTVGAEKIPLPIYFIDVDRSDEGKKIYSVTEILNIKINVTSYKKGDNITQYPNYRNPLLSPNHAQPAPKPHSAPSLKSPSQVPQLPNKPSRKHLQPQLQPQTHGQDPLSSHDKSPSTSNLSHPFHRPTLPQALNQASISSPSSTYSRNTGSNSKTPRTS